MSDKAIEYLHGVREDFCHEPVEGFGLALTDGLEDMNVAGISEEVFIGTELDMVIGPSLPAE